MNPAPNTAHRGRSFALRTSMLLFAVALAAAACSSTPGEGSELGCAEEVAAETMLTCEALQAEQSRIGDLNASPRNLDIDSASCPTTLGTLSGTELVVEEGYACSDVCPDAGYIFLKYRGIDNEADCTEAGGTAIIDYAWGETFVGCTPSCAP